MSCTHKKKKKKRVSKSSRQFTFQQLHERNLGADPAVLDWRHWTSTNFKPHGPDDGLVVKSK